jgi:DNA-binding NarL/FixJ family response regulator
MTTPAGLPVRALIVDDSAAFRAAASAMLTRGGITVVGTATDGAEAVTLTREHRPDVALVDVDLGRDSGFDVAERLRGTPVILISTHDEQDVTDLVGASCARGFLPKFALTADAVRAMLGTTT